MEAWIAGVAGAALVAVAWIAVWSLRRREDGSDEPAATLVLGPDLLPRGRVEVQGDLVIRADADRAAGRRAEMDVPTREVDGILAALHGAGFDVRDTGLTVDTDEGEETLTTITLDVASMAGARAPGHPQDRLHVHGDLIAEAGVRVGCNLEVDGNATVHDRVVLAGSLRCRGTVHVGADCHVIGDIEGQGDVHIGARTAVRTIIAKRDVHFAEADRDAMQRVQARRVHVAPDVARP